MKITSKFDVRHLILLALQQIGERSHLKRNLGFESQDGALLGFIVRGWQVRKMNSPHCTIIMDHTHTHTHTHARMHTHTHTHAPTHTHPHTHTHAYMQTNTHTHTHTKKKVIFQTLSYPGLVQLKVSNQYFLLHNSEGSLGNQLT